MSQEVQRHSSINSRSLRRSWKYTLRCTDLSWRQFSGVTQNISSQRLLVVAFPLLLLIGSTATGVGILYSFTRVEPEADIFVHEISQWIISFFSMTLATNVICTSLVAYRIWYINSRHMAFFHRRLRPVMLLIVESGAAYSATLLSLLILYKAGSWFQYVVLDAISSIVGLVFSVIILRIAVGVTSDSGETRLLGITDITMASPADRGLKTVQSDDDV